MKRVLLAGVSLTVTACAMSSATPPSTAPHAASRGLVSPHLLSLAPTQACTLWREFDGRRVCLDGAQHAAEALPSLPTRQSPPASPDAAALVESPPVAAPRMKVTSEPLPEPAMPKGEAVTQRAQALDLFADMRRMGMIKAPVAQAPATPSLPVAGTPIVAAPQPAAEKTEANIDPKTAPVVPSNDLASLARVAPGVFATGAQRPVRARQGFAATAMEAPIATVTAVAAPMTGDVSASWQPPVQAAAVTAAPSGPMATQLADAGPAPRAAAGGTAGRAPVAAVDRVQLPSVQPQRVVPLRIAKKASDDEPAVVVPALPGSGAPGSMTQMAGTLPPALPVPVLPPMPGETPSAAAPAAAPAKTAAPATGAPAAAKAASARSAATASPAPPPLPAPPPDLAGVEPAPAKVPQPEARPARIARPAAPEAKLSRAALDHATPAAPRATAAAKAPAARSLPEKPAAGRYLVLHSFREASRARRLAKQYSHLDAKVASVTLHGQTWHRVVVRDGALQRSRLASDGVRGYWPVTL